MLLFSLSIFLMAVKKDSAIRNFNSSKALNQFQNTNIVQHNAYIELKTANQTIKLFVEVKNEIREQNLPQLLSVMKKEDVLRANKVDYYLVGAMARDIRLSVREVFQAKRKQMM